MGYWDDADDGYDRWVDSRANQEYEAYLEAQADAHYAELEREHYESLEAAQAAQAAQAAAMDEVREQVRSGYGDEVPF